MTEANRDTHKVWVTASVGDTARELEISFAPETTIADLSAALADDLSPSVESDWVLSSTRLDRELPPGDRILDSGLVSGDRLELRSEARADVDPDPGGAVDLVVVGGPLLGTRYRLDLGRHLLGRGSAAEVTIEDPSMSRTHLDVSVTADGVTVTDAGSTNGTFIDGEKLTGTRAIGPGDVIEAGGSLLAFEPALSLSATSVAEGVTIPFNRPPRVRPATREMTVDLPAPPDDATRPRIPLAVSIVPLVIGIALVLLFPENKAMLLFFAMTPVIAVWSFLEERRSGTKSFRSESAEYADEIETIESRLSAFVEENLHDRRDAFPDASELTVRVRDLSPRLWERRPADTDFLSIRVGWGDEPSNVEMVTPSMGSRALRDETTERLSRFTMLRAVPIVVSLRDAQITGFCGQPEDVDALTRWAIAQLSTLHSPDELEISAILASAKAADWDWLKWLPHLGAQADRGRIVFESEALNLIERSAPDTDARRSPDGPHSLVVIDGDCEVPRSALGRVLRAAGRDLSILWLGKDPRELPGECRAVVEVDTAGDRLLVVEPERGVKNEHHGPEGISDDHARAIAHALAPVRDAGIGPRRRSVPTRVGLWETLGIADPSSDLLRERWRTSASDRLVRLGSAGGFSMDIDLRRDGPHALIGGTTGAGKSELLRSIVAAIAFEQPPDRVNLFLIDYKGGTAFEDLTPLPHVVGCVTDLDRHLARRTLVSLEAELRRREVVLRDAGARDVRDLAKTDGLAPPDLVILVDEFAALVTDLPEFVDGMVDIAQRGRALGLHLILATQKPAGVVSEKIRANTNLRIALRMSDEADSMDVIGLPDAAHIPRTLPGRGFVRMGHGEVVEFQSPFASAPAVTERTEKSIVLRRLGPAGVDHGDIDEDVPDDAPSELDALIEAVIEAGGGATKGYSPVLPPLPEVVRLDDLGPPSAPGRFPVGLTDEPARQRQQPFEVDFERDGSVLVYGTGGSGKTTFLRTIAASIATHSSPEESYIYAVDLGARGLEALDALPHCGAVIFADEEERIRRLFAMLRDEIARRRSSPSSPDRSRMVVLLDGYAGFAAAFERVEFGEMVDELPRLVADGRSVGLHFVITADRRGAVPAALSGIIATKIVLRLADDDEYAAFGISAGPDVEALSTRGRAFLADGIVAQCAVPGEGASVTEQLEALGRLGTTTEATTGPPPVRTLPADLDVLSLPPARGWWIPIGFDERFEEAVCDLSDGHLAIVGPRRSGRSTTLTTIAAQMSRTAEGSAVFLLSPRAKASKGAVGTVVSGMDASETWMTESQAKLEAAGPSLVLIDDGDELFDVGAGDALQRTMRWARDNDVRFVVAVESHAAHRAFGGWFAEMKKEKHGILLDPDVEVDGDLFGARLPRRKLSFPPGRGYLLSRGDSKLIQVARPFPAEGGDEEPDRGSQP
jgi:S-DNA-T family DNA segregation ATPase FtsK/SpoIIIE